MIASSADGPTHAMASLLQRMARAGARPLWELGVQRARELHELGSGVLDVAPPAVAAVLDLDCPTRDGARLGVRCYRPTPLSPHDASPALLYLHGGGFVLGSLDSHDVLCRQLAMSAGCTVFALDYRLAPEHPFPCAVDDAWDALTWLHAHGAMLGIDSARIAVAGDSAGGTLATTCALHARAIDLPLALQLMFYPGTAGWARTASAQRYAKGFVLEQEHIDWFFGLYLQEVSDRDDWRFAPLRAPDLRGVAPAWIGLAGCDILHDEGVAYAERLRDAGVAVELHTWAGVTHDFIRMGRAIPQAGQAIQFAARALRAALGT